MGKIFKALEKAEKQPRVNASRQSRTKQRRLSEELDASRLESIVPAPSNDQRSPAAPSPSSDQPVVDATKEPRPKLRLGERPEPAPAPVDQPESAPSVAPEPVSKPVETPDSAKITIVKAEKTEPSTVVQDSTAYTSAGANLANAAKTPLTHSRDGVKVRYSRTQVQANDPQRLIENKVLSIFENFETTNQFKLLRTQVLRKLKMIGGNSILVTSANPYEGKTFTSINLGVSIAKEFDRTVLIIDADIRRPTRQHTDFSTSFFSLKVEKGLTDYLEGNADIEEILINPGIDKLTLIPGGVPVDNSPEYLNSFRMKEMMQEIKNRYPADRLVIVDGPAILHFPDAMILNHYVDGVLPVVEAEKTSAEDLKKMMKHLSEVNILGVVLNKKRG